MVGLLAVGVLVYHAYRLVQVYIGVAFIVIMCVSNVLQQ